jgi:hypothetical protein
VKKEHFPSDLDTIERLLIENKSETVPVDGLIFTPVGSYRFGYEIYDLLFLLFLSNLIFSKSEFLLKYQTGSKLTIDVEVATVVYEEYGSKVCNLKLPNDFLNTIDR